MAGGSGTRFWPLSKETHPKQFIDILGTGRTLLQQTFERFRKIFPLENIFIVTGLAYKQITLDQLPEIPENQVLLEPHRRNTAPCVAYATHKIKSICPDANFIVSPADHLIINELSFLEVISKGLVFAAGHTALLTIGIKPTSPQTGYGYIQINTEDEISSAFNGFKKVKTFTEKPDLEMAKIFLESGEFFWNSGIFIWSAKAISEALEVNLPEVNTLFENKNAVYNTVDEAAFIENAYSDCRNISIDYGIMEKAENVYVVCADFGWSDLGTWSSLYEHSTKDANGNVITSSNTLDYNLKNCIVKVPEDKLVVLNGLENYIVVETDNVLLVCPISEEQEIKQIVNQVKMLKGGEYI